MNRLHSAPKEAKQPLPPDYKLSGEEQSPCQSSAVAGTGAIRGRVTQAPGGTIPIENIEVAAYKLTCPYYSAYAYSDSDGYYIIDSLPAGKYEVWTYNDSIFLDIVWNDKRTWETIDTVVVVLNDTTDSINFKLPVGGKITGRVTMLGASSFVTVTAYDTLSEGDYSADVYIDFDSASYEIRRLPTGIYKVYTATTDSFAPEYYNNKQGWASADPIRVKEDSITSNIDFTLAVGGKITGTVKLPGASSVSVTVWATDTTTEDSYYGSASNPSGDSATYEIVGLPTGTYKVNTNTYYSQGYLGEYYSDKPDWASADPIRVKEDSITSNINFTLALGGKITGTVKLPGASSISTTVLANETTTGYPYWVSASNPSGDSATYEIAGLPTGTYKVYTYNSQGYLDEYYHDKPDYASADTIHVTAGSIRPNINLTLTLGGIIKGNVSSSSKGPVKGVKVDVFYTTNPTSYAKYGSTNSSGDYKIVGLQSRYYKILAYGDTIYAPKYYDNDTSWSSADSVLVTVSDSVSGNFTLEVGGSIRGHVYGDGAVPLSGAYVTASGHFDLYPVERSKTTPADGSYKIGGLPTGYYKVRASDGCKLIYYNNKPSSNLADSVFVTMPDSVININFNFLTTAVEDENDQTTRRPSEFELSQNYPNPFNPETKIEYALKKTGHVTLYIYNVLGEKVKTLLDQDQPAGFYQINWDGKNDNGKPISSGIYLYKLEVNGFSEAKRMLLLK